MRRSDGRLNAPAWLGVSISTSWRDYDPAVVEEELALLRAHGLNLTRSFPLWPDFHPKPDRLDKTMLQRYEDLLDRHAAQGMATVSTLLSGEPSWCGGRDPYRDVWLVARQAWHVRELTARFADHPAVAGWLLEAPARDGEVLESWAQLMIDAVRAGGARQAVSLDHGHDPRRLAAIVDWTCPQASDDDPLGVAFACELARLGGQPVVLNDLGAGSDHFCRLVLHATLLAGATGWLAPNAPSKPQLLEMTRFADTLTEIDFDRCERLPVDTALVVSAAVDRWSYVAARQADLALGFEHEADGIAEGYLLYLVPSTARPAAASWRRLAALAEQGATVYASHPEPDEMFGVENQRRYGRPHPVSTGPVRFTFRTDFAGLHAGDELVFDAGHTYLPVRPVSAEVVAVDDEGNPALLVKRHGAGRLVLCTYPLEQMANAYRLYDALAEAAEVYRPVAVPDPRILVDGLRHADGREWYCLLNLSPDRVTARPGATLPPYGVEWLSCGRRQ
ncbi:beta-mannosidase [Kutzneria buriramensis]|uniref:Beta-galactosidase-like protein n=1 Tax=Kutzneria buriramensis TaxID=1045776 RepID=A0A3E0HAJ3_9PSEU|nr:beta-mannosidase [Kutzneria buriramensis]REH41053.1 hypothetical protein BCF44_112135 [Kutzneria buriramensis]